MTAMLNPACPLCGLRYANKPLLDLHIRDDHSQRRHAQPGRREPGSGASPPSAGSPSRRYGQNTEPSSTTKEATVTTATHSPQRGPVMTAWRRALRTLRHVS